VQVFQQDHQRALPGQALEVLFQVEQGAIAALARVLEGERAAGIAGRQAELVPEQAADRAGALRDPGGRDRQPGPGLRQPALPFLAHDRRRIAFQDLEAG
jgi:hypothetical protein